MHRRQAASHRPWPQQDSGITLSASMGMIGVLEIMLIVPTLRVGMPLRTLRVRSRMWRRCVDKLQRYPRHALGSLNPQSVPFVTRSVTGCMPTRSDGHDQCRGRFVYNDERGAMGTIGVLEISDRYHALRGNASRDAPRPRWVRLCKAYRVGAAFFKGSAEASRMAQVARSTLPVRRNS